MENAFGGFGIFLLLFLLLLGVLWFLLPFAIFGTKAKLDAIIAENMRTNELLKSLVSEIRASKSEGVANKEGTSNRLGSFSSRD
jgi:hypothetical protein